MRKIGAFIPARYAATRFPAKLMQMLGDKTVIRHTYDNTLATGLFDEVYVVTDSEIIFNEIVDNGGKAIMSQRSHESGSDRIAEAIADLDIDIIYSFEADPAKHLVDNLRIPLFKPNGILFNNPEDANKWTFKIVIITSRGIYTANRYITENIIGCY